MLSKVLRLCSLLRRNNAKAKLNQILTNANFLVGGSSNASKTSNPNIIPKIPPEIERDASFWINKRYSLSISLVWNTVCKPITYYVYELEIFFAEFTVFFTSLREWSVWFFSHLQIILACMHIAYIPQQNTKYPRNLSVF